MLSLEYKLIIKTATMINYGIIQDRHFKALDNKREELKLAADTLAAKTTNLVNTTNSVELHLLNDCFRQLKMSADVRGICQPGETIQDFNTKGITIDITATPLPGCKIKPVIFNGYTESGASRNEKKRREKTKKLVEAITFLTGYKCDVNQFSMERKSSTESFAPMITLFIPNPSTL